ncbi:MAG: short-chain dehydrogenase [Marinilabiliales bacterium]|nr:MAG: short-chain dehydrogenase [Marinilabiliales bacterium]
MNQKKRKYALILGATGSFGLASAKILSKKGFDLILVYRELKSSLEIIKPEINKLKEKSDVLEFNLNIIDEDNQMRVIEELKKSSKIRNNISFLLHSIADGNLNTMFASEDNPDRKLYLQDFQHTIDSMGTSLYKWTDLLLQNDLFSSNASVLGLTSEGTKMVLKDYAAVAAAKSVMESNVKYMAIELADKGIRTNLINAGITDSKALKVFPDYDSFIEKAKQRNPNKRLTTAEDVAKVIAFMASEESEWINGSIINVDGGEQLLSIY